MKVYANPGVVDTYTPTGDGSSAQCLKALTGVFVSTESSGLMPTTVTSDTELAKDGQSRAMLKIQTRIPKALLDHAVGMQTNNSTPQFKKDLLPAVHVVFTGYPELVRLATAKTGGAAAIDEKEIGKLIAWQIRSLVALCFGRSLPNDWETLPLDGSIVRGLLGIEPLDVVQGSYGTAVAAE